MMSKTSWAYLPALASLAIGGVFVDCVPGDSKEGGLEPPPGGVVAIVLSADSIAVEPAQTYAFNASGRLSDGTIVNVVPLTWEASGGTISSEGPTPPARPRAGTR